MSEYSVMRRWDEEHEMWVYVVLYGTETKAKIIAQRNFLDLEHGDVWADDLIREKKLQ